MDNKMYFFKGETNIFEDSKEKEQKDEKKEIQKDITKIFSSSHLSFLLGAGCSFPAIPTMNKMFDGLPEELNKQSEELNKQYENLLSKLNEDVKKNKNLEKILEFLYAKDFISNLEIDNNQNSKPYNAEDLISKIKEHIFNECNSNEKSNTKYEKCIENYTNFYKKLMYRENSLSKINIFTTNYDLFNEKAMDDLGIIYCNGFSGVVNRYFNPATFNYAYAEQIGLSEKKYNVLDKYIYFYKLHGSINWIEDNNPSLFNIKEIQTPTFKDNHIMIYPTPAKQSNTFSSPYSDLFREFQKKLLQQDNILVVIGYSFADEHINNVIYQALATIPKFRLIIFSYDKIKDNNDEIENNIENNNEIQKLKDSKDPRIWIIQGKDENDNNIASFEYIVKNFLLEIDENDETLEKALKQYYNKK